MNKLRRNAFPRNQQGVGLIETMIAAVILLVGVMAANVTCGGVDPANPQAGYVDYLSPTGVVVGGAAQATFTRQWQIDTDGTGRIKTITVQTTAPAVANQTAPITILTTFKSKDGF